MEEWKNTLRELNKNVTRYSRAVAASEARLRLEAELLKQSMTHDILDREATFTSTLEAIRSVESKAGEGSSSSSEFLDGSVARAMQAVSSINSAMGSITAAKEPFYADAAECAALTSGGNCVDDFPAPTHPPVVKWIERRVPIARVEQHTLD